VASDSVYIWAQWKKIIDKETFLAILELKNLSIKQSINNNLFRFTLNLCSLATFASKTENLFYIADLQSIYLLNVISFFQTEIQ
jgi:hypothetical protein